LLATPETDGFRANKGLAVATFDGVAEVTLEKCSGKFKTHDLGSQRRGESVGGEAGRVL